MKNGMITANIKTKHTISILAAGALAFGLALTSPANTEARTVMTDGEDGSWSDNFGNKAPSEETPSVPPAGTNNVWDDQVKGKIEESDSEEAEEEPEEVAEAEISGASRQFKIDEAGYLNLYHWNELSKGDKLPSDGKTYPLLLEWNAGQDEPYYYNGNGLNDKDLSYTYNNTLGYWNAGRSCDSDGLVTDPEFYSYKNYANMALRYAGENHRTGWSQFAIAVKLNRGGPDLEIEKSDNSFSVKDHKGSIMYPDPDTWKKSKTQMQGLRFLGEYGTYNALSRALDFDTEKIAKNWRENYGLWSIMLDSGYRAKIVSPYHRYSETWGYTQDAFLYALTYSGRWKEDDDDTRFLNSVYELSCEFYDQDDDTGYNDREAIRAFAAYIGEKEKWPAITKDITIDAGDIFRIDDEVVLPEGITINVKEGGVLIVGGKFFNAGVIKNSGTVIVEEKGFIQPFKADEYTVKDSNYTNWKRGTMKIDGGALLVLKGGVVICGENRKSLLDLNKATIDNYGAIVTNSCRMKGSTIVNEAGGRFNLGFQGKPWIMFDWYGKRSQFLKAKTRSDLSMYYDYMIRDFDENISVVGRESYFQWFTGKDKTTVRNDGVIVTNWETHNGKKWNITKDTGLVWVD